MSSLGSKPYFDGLGARWDELGPTFFTPAVREQALAAAEAEPGALAADVGAGTGYVTEELLARGLRVIAVDQSRPMLDALGAKLGPSAPVELRQGEAEALPIEDGAVDYAFANMFLHHVESPPAAIAEMVRILRPGGTLVITDLQAHDFEFLVREHHDRWQGFALDVIRGWFEGAGLADVRVEPTCEGCQTTSSAGQEADIGIFIASGRQPRGPERPGVIGPTAPGPRAPGGRARAEGSSAPARGRRRAPSGRDSPPPPSGRSSRGRARPSCAR